MSGPGPGAPPRRSIQAAKSPSGTKQSSMLSSFCALGRPSAAASARTSRFSYPPSGSSSLRRCSGRMRQSM